MVFAGVGTNENILAYTLTTSLAAVLAIGWPQRPGATDRSGSPLLAFHGYGLYRAEFRHGVLRGSHPRRRNRLPRGVAPRSVAPATGCILATAALVGRRPG